MVWKTLKIVRNMYHIKLYGVRKFRVFWFVIERIVTEKKIEFC